ncbi:MAG TPA: hypothetical protein DDZ51_22860 [Planctomycetaceae bacterium]|nr:hypothetical protein [Planctomycetaceae bacterium]
MINANWGLSTDVVYQFSRQSPHASILLRSHGRFVGASSNPFSEYKRRPGDRVGLNWHVPQDPRQTRHPPLHLRHKLVEVIHALATAIGDYGCLSLFSDRSDQHRMFVEQVIPEYFVRTECRSRTVDEWKARHKHPNNHWIDCLIGYAVGASMQIALLFGTDLPSAPNRERISFKDLQGKRRV